jgi:hypothetical protein
MPDGGLLEPKCGASAYSGFGFVLRVVVRLCCYWLLCLLPGAWGFPPASRLPRCLEARDSWLEWLSWLSSLLAPPRASQAASSKQQAASTRGYADTRRRGGLALHCHLPLLLLPLPLSGVSSALFDSSGFERLRGV